MPAAPLPNTNESTFDKVKRLVELRLELVWTQVKLAITSSLSTAALYLAVGIFGLLFILFTSLAAAWGLGQAWENPALGFLAVAGIYLILAIICIAVRDNITRSVQTAVDKAVDRMARAGLDDMDMDEVTRAALPGADSRLEGLTSPAPVTDPAKADPQNAPRLSNEARDRGERLEDSPRNTPRPDTGNRRAA